MTTVPLLVDTVNMPYHHGGLRQALIDAAYELARTGGPDEVVLRAASRTAGVSHNAAYRHFADREDLLRAVRQRAMEALATRMTERQDAVEPTGNRADDAWNRVEATGRAYVEFALSEPGLFRTVFGVAPEDDQVVPGVGWDPFAILNVALDALVDAGAITPQRRVGAEYAAWAAVHGVSSLLTDGPLRDLDPDVRRVVVDRVIATVRLGL